MISFIALLVWTKHSPFGCLLLSPILLITTSFIVHRHRRDYTYDPQYFETPSTPSSSEPKLAINNKHYILLPPSSKSKHKHFSFTNPSSHHTHLFESQVFVYKHRSFTYHLVPTKISFFTRFFNAKLLSSFKRLATRHAKRLGHFKRHRTAPNGLRTKQLHHLH